MPEHFLLTDLLLAYAIVLAFILAFARLKVPPVVAMIAAGAVAGPAGLGLIATAEAVEALAEIGVVLLLFTVGLDFSLASMSRVWRAVLIGGLGQIIGTAVVAAALVSVLAPESPRMAIFLGAFVALSSTAIVLKGLTERNQIDTPHGRLAVGVLLLQDLAVVLLLLLVPFLAGTVSAAEAPVALLKAAAALVLVAVMSRLGLPVLLRAVSRSGRREAFPLAILLASVGTAWFSSLLGVSMELGAFLGGLVLAGGEFSHQAHAEVRPLRDILSSLFFVSLGSLVDPEVLLRQWPLVLGTALIIVVLKVGVATAALALTKTPLRVALTSGIVLAQVGEFSFILGRAALEADLLTRTIWQVLLAASIATMVATPALIAAGPGLAARFTRRREPPADLDEVAAAGGHVVILGFGEGGRMIGKVLRARQIPYLVMELNGNTVMQERLRGEPLRYGDATNPDSLHGAGVDHARAVVIVLSDPFASARAVDGVRSVSATVPVLVRTRYRLEAEHMRRLGASLAVAEEIETSIEVLAQLLGVLGLPGNLIENDLERVRLDLPSNRPIYAPRASLGELPAHASTPVATHEIEADDWAVGRSIADIGLRKATSVSVLAIQSGEEYLVPAPPTRPLAAGDLLYLLGTLPAVATARRLLTSGEMPAPSET